MFFPKVAQNIIADIFYDKNIYILDKTESIDDEGGVVKQEDVNSNIKQSKMKWVLLRRLILVSLVALLWRLN